MAGSKDHFLKLLHSAQGNFDALMTLNKDIQKAALACADDNDLVQDPMLGAFRQAVGQLLPKVTDGKDAATLIALLMALTAAEQGRKAGLNIGLKACLMPECEKSDTDFLYKVLRQYGWLAKVTPADIADVRTIVRPEKQKQDLGAYYLCTKTFKFLGFGVETDRAWNKMIFENLALSWLEQMLSLNFYNAALQCEHYIYNGWVRQYEVMDHYQESFLHWAGPMEKAGQDFAKTLAPVARARPARPLVGIFVHYTYWLAHIDLMFQTLKMNTQRDYDLRVYFFMGQDEGTRTKLDAAGIQSCFLDELNYPQTSAERLVALRERLAQDGVHTLIWLCQPTMLSFAMGMRLAPHQVYWSMRHPISALSSADAYWTAHNSSPIHVYGREWKTTPVTYAATSRPAADEIAKIRNEFPADAVLLGTIAREHKLNAPEFLGAICTILKNHPNAYYLYTAREDAAPIRNYFTAQGVAERTKCVGWVDPRLYAEVFDIYADCWPARSGMTAFAALEAHIPIVFNIAADENHDFVRKFFFYFHVEKRDDGYHLPDPALDADFTLLDGKRALLACEGVDDYIATMGRLIEDHAYRKACGAAGRALYTYLTDISIPAKKVDDLFLQAIKDAA